MTTTAKKIRILFLAHDLTDAAIAKHLEMLELGDALVTVAGFRRSESPISLVGRCQATDFGRTKNGSFVLRLLSVINTIIHIRKFRSLFEAADVVIGRNLEMLAIAVSGSKILSIKPTIIYEVLDIHRLLTGSSPISRGLRWLERTLLQHTSAIFTSSPAFIKSYFDTLNPTSLPFKLIENKRLKLPLTEDYGKTTISPERPWIIGWFGIIRCRKSLHILADVVRRCGGTVKVIIRGRPAIDQIPEFHEFVASTPGLSFQGPYKNPDELSSIYNSIHFNWVIDRYEEGLNSSWLLPNRLYEGGYYGVVPIAEKNVETGHYYQQLNIGLLLEKLDSEFIANTLMNLSHSAYIDLSESAQAVPKTQWYYDINDCKELVNYISNLAPSTRLDDNA